MNIQVTVVRVLGHRACKTSVYPPDIDVSSRSKASIYHALQEGLHCCLCLPSLNLARSKFLVQFRGGNGYVSN